MRPNTQRSGEGIDGVFQMYDSLHWQHRMRSDGSLFMQVSQGSSYPWWLVAVAKHSLLWCECVGRWWQPSGDIGILP